MLKDKVFHVISNTHWDREWRFPFQKNRQMLVDMIDKTLEILQNEPDYRAFHLDSQSVVLDDYLAVKPHMKDLIKKLVTEKRLLIGPWFILPEEFQVGGENLVRNLLLGHRICREFGGVSKIGYSPFSWGQISQLPQIYKEFGVDVIMFYRGINSIDSPKAEFLWEGADGTKALTSRFSTMPRYNFYFYIYRTVVHNENFSDVEYKLSKGGVPFHFSDNELFNEDYYITKPVDSYYSENIAPSVSRIIENQVNDFTTPNVIWMEGHDSSGPNIKTARIIKDIRELCSDVNVVHSTLEEYASALKASADYDTLKLVKGERRSAQYDNRSGNLYGYTTSARMYLKQKNFETEKWLQFYAEPFNSLAGLLGLDTNNRYLDLAWYYLLENSAHDSIGGCSLDEIHSDMLYRYKQSIEISKGVFERAAKYISTCLDLSSQPENSLHIVSLNATNYVRNDIQEVYVDVPQEYESCCFELMDSDSKPVALQIVEKSDCEPVLEQMTDRPMFFRMKRYRCFAEFADVDPFGIRTYRIQPAEKAAKTKDKKDTKAAKDKKIVRTSKNGLYLENDYLFVKINPNGTFDVTDKTTKQKFNGLGYLYDEGEAGHAWVNKPSKPFITSLKSKTEILQDINGPLYGSVKIRHKFAVPENLGDNQHRSKSKVKIPIELTVSITANSKRVDIDVKLDNRAEDHRLRIMFPTGIDARYSYGEGQFDVPARSSFRPETKDWIEQPMYDYPMHHFVDISDGQTGCAVLVDGLKEYEYINDKQKTLAITLLRAFKFIIAPSSVQDYSYQKGSQCPGENRYRMAFYPHKGDWNTGSVYKEALCFNTELRLFETGRTTGSLAPDTSFMKIEPEELIFSALKKPENDSDPRSYILRFYNPTDFALKGKISTLFNIKRVSVVTLEEKPVSEITPDDKNSFTITAERKKIITLKIDFE